MLTKMVQEITDKNELAPVEKTKEVLIEQREHINQQIARIETHEVVLDINTLGVRLADAANALSVLQIELNRAWLRMQQMHEDVLRIKQKLDKS
ncbi:MAG TPA: hypothetical protein VJK07_00280 [Candidatus Nanoarchaeia archaeon]|nr:hypothetical protein [Candidatus Nanoarchaeia archaeon]